MFVRLIFTAWPSGKKNFSGDNFPIYGNSYTAYKLFVLHVFLACAVSFEINKPGNVESIQIISRVS